MKWQCEFVLYFSDTESHDTSPQKLSDRCLGHGHKRVAKFRNMKNLGRLCGTSPDKTTSVVVHTKVSSGQPAIETSSPIDSSSSKENTKKQLSEPSLSESDEEMFKTVHQRNEMVSSSFHFTIIVYVTLTILSASHLSIAHITERMCELFWSVKVDSGYRFIWLGQKYSYRCFCVH